MSAPRLPAYGKEVLAALGPGVPLAVYVAEDWSGRPPGAVAIARDWRPALCAWERFGLRPARVTGDGSISWVVVLAIAAELSDFLMPVEVTIGEITDEVDAWAFGNRECVAGDPPRFRWPVWWSDEREAFYARRRAAYWRRLVQEACHAPLH